MRQSVPFAAVLFIALLFAAPVAAQMPPNEIILTVNEQPVYSWEVGMVIPQVQQEMARQGMQPEQEMVIQAAMQRVVDSKLLSQEARRREMQPNDQRVEETLTQVETQAGGREKLDEALARLGMTYPMFEASVVESDLVRVFIETTIDPTLSVTPEEVKAFYDDNPEMFQQPEQVHARHILAKASADSTEAEKAAARAKAAAARKRAVAGDDFATLAIELSEGPSASEGGDLGFFGRQQMVAPFADAAFALDEGQISEVVETQFGYHVILVEEKKPATTMALDQVRQPLEQMLLQNKGGEATNKVLEELAANATITQVGGGAAAADAAPAGE